MPQGFLDFSLSYLQVRWCTYNYVNRRLTNRYEYKMLFLGTGEKETRPIPMELRKVASPAFLRFPVCAFFCTVDFVTVTSAEKKELHPIITCCNHRSPCRKRSPG
jgi:hypothetical protein